MVTMAVRDAHHSAASSRGAGVMTVRAETRSTSTMATAATANAPGAGIGHDLESAGAIERGEQSVGGVGQAVEVEHAGEGEIGGHDHRRADQGRPHVVGPPPQAAEDEADQRADDGEPGHGGGVGHRPRRPTG